jgi:hypothetical protein
MPCFGPRFRDHTPIRMPVPQPILPPMRTRPPLLGTICWPQRGWSYPFSPAGGLGYLRHETDDFADKARLPTPPLKNRGLSGLSLVSHRLSARKLAALTAVRNYHSRRPDGTTAARRFFGRAHAPLFEQLLDRVPLPPRPRRRRPPPSRQPYLMPVAA